MLNLHDYIAEQLSDSSIFYRMGVYRLNHIAKADNNAVKKLVDKFKISKNDPRPGVLRFIHHDTVPIRKPETEIIPRGDWDLDSLVGETEGQLLHPDYYRLNKHIMKNHKKGHNVLTIFQCSSKKPYTENAYLADRYFNVFGDYTDLASISNPGIIPVEFCDYYPYRYDEWNVEAEGRLKEIIDITHKYRIVNMCRFIRYRRTLGYDDVICVIGNPKKQWIFDEMVKHDIDGAKSWLHIVLDDTFRNKVHNMSTYKDVPMGILGTRIPGFPVTVERYAEILMKCCNKDEKPEIKEIIDDRMEKARENRSRKDESLEKPEYKILEDIDYKDFLEKFKKQIEDNMADPKVDLGKNDLYYKSYYWTCLDLLLIALDGNLIEDIDGAYWKMYELLDKDENFTLIARGHDYGNFAFAYEPLLKHDKVSLDTCTKEAFELGIVRDKKRMVLNDRVFN